MEATARYGIIIAIKLFHSLKHNPIKGALPPIKEVWSFVTEQQTERYKDLKRAAKLVLQAVEAPDNDLLKYVSNFS